MAEQESEIVVSNSADEGGTLLEGLRRVLMAGIGVAVLAQEEIEDFVTKLVDIVHSIRQVHMQKVHLPSQ